MARNYFTSRLTAERYAAARPYLHPLIVDQVGRRTGTIDRALDVGCGTGMSSRAIESIAHFVVGIDPSTRMLACAEPHPRVSYSSAVAEDLPFRTASFDLVSAGLAFHWFDRTRFLAEAHRVLAPGGWLLVYNTWFCGAMRENPEFSIWSTTEYLRRFPTTPRAGNPLSDDEARENGFDVVERSELEQEVKMSPQNLAIYLTTQSNVSAIVEAGRATLAEVTEWLTDSVEPMFDDAEATFPFGGAVWLFQRRH